jgi:hypothetical protein
MISREDYKEPKISHCRDFFGIEYMIKIAALLIFVVDLCMFKLVLS